MSNKNLSRKDRKKMRQRTESKENKQKQQLIELIQQTPFFDRDILFPQLCRNIILKKTDVSYPHSFFSYFSRETLQRLGIFLEYYSLDTFNECYEAVYTKEYISNALSHKINNHILPSFFKEIQEQIVDRFIDKNSILFSFYTILPEKKGKNNYQCFFESTDTNISLYEKVISAIDYFLYFCKVNALDLDNIANISLSDNNPIDNSKVETTISDIRFDFFALNFLQQKALLQNKDLHSDMAWKQVMQYIRNCIVYNGLTSDDYLFNQIYSEVIFKIFKNIESFIGESDIKTWIFRIIVNTFYTEKHRKINNTSPIIGSKENDYNNNYDDEQTHGSIGSIEGGGQYCNGETDTPEKWLYRLERLQQIEDSIEECKINDQHYQIFTMFYTGHSMQEITEKLGVNVSTVKSALFQIRKRLRANAGILALQ